MRETARIRPNNSAAQRAQFPTTKCNLAQTEKSTLEEGIFVWSRMARLFPSNKTTLQLEDPGLCSPALQGTVADRAGWPVVHRMFVSWPPLLLGPPVVPFYPCLAEGSPTKIDYRKKGTLILSSLLEDLDCIWVFGQDSKLLVT